MKRSRSWYRLNLARGDRMARVIPPGKPARSVSRIRRLDGKPRAGYIYTDPAELIDAILSAGEKE